MAVDADRPDRRHPILGGANWLVGGLVTVVAGVLATLLAVVFAATVALAAVLVSGALAVWAVAFRVQKATRFRPAATGAVVIEARKFGHGWVAYGWDQAPG